MGFLLYFLVVQASLLSRVVGSGNVHKAVDGAGNSVVWNTYRAVHMTIGLVIMIPTLVVAFFPFMTHFQVMPSSIVRSRRYFYQFGGALFSEYVCVCVFVCVSAWGGRSCVCV